MAYKKFSDFVVFDPPDVSDYLVGYRELGGEFRSTIQDLTEIFKRLAIPLQPQNVYVSLSGNDSEVGTSEAFSFRTIKRGLAKALELSRTIPDERLQFEQTYGWGTASAPVTVFVKSGEYIEDNPIYVPPNVTVVGDNIKTVTVNPKNKFYDIFWVNNNSSIQNINFKNYFSPAYAIAYPEFGYLKNNSVSEYPSSRLLSASGRAVKYYYDFVNHPNPFIYNVTKKFRSSFLNYSKDSGEEVFNPFEIAFLGRYFRDLNDQNFYTNQEYVQQLDFWETKYFNLSVNKPHIIQAPYIMLGSTQTQGTSANVLDAGSSIIVDGNNVNGPFKSMVVNSFNHFNQGGNGVYITNNGYANVKNNTFLLCNESVKSDFGGTCFVNGSNTSYGLSGLISLGKSPKPTLVGQLLFPLDLSSTVQQITITNIGSFELLPQQEFKTNFQPYFGQLFSIVDESYLLATIGINALTATNSGTFFEVLSASPLRTASLPFDGFECDVILKTPYEGTNDSSIFSNPLVDPPPVQLNAGSKVKFFIGSKIIASSHAFDTNGSGVNYNTATSLNGGVKNASTEVIDDGIGKVYFNTTDEIGNFRIGKYFNYSQYDSTLTLGHENDPNSLNVLGVSNIVNISARNIIVENLSATNTNMVSLSVGNILTNSLTANRIVSRDIIVQGGTAVSPVSVINLTSTFTFSNTDNSKIFHFDTTTSHMSAIFPPSLIDGFNVALMNTGTGLLYLSAPSNNYKSFGRRIFQQYGSAYVYKKDSDIFAVGRLDN